MVHRVIRVRRGPLLRGDGGGLVPRRQGPSLGLRTNLVYVTLTGRDSSGNSG